MPMFRPGDEIAGPDRVYRVEALQGSGASGATYRVAELPTGRTLIVKAIDLRGLAEWKVLELFEREAAALRRIDHPRIPRYEASFILDDGRAVTRPEDVRTQPTFMLVQEFIGGETLAARVRARGPLSPPLLTRLFNALLDLAAYLHGLAPPISHRDIQPGNIILDETDEPHLVDFGAVRDCLRAEGSVGSTTAGTFGYMPAEQAMGTARPASDLYALAMTVVVAATGLDPSALPMDDRTGKVRLHTLGLPDPLIPALDGMLEPIVGNRLDSVAAVRKVLARGGRRPPRVRAIALASVLGMSGMIALQLARAPRDQEFATLVVPMPPLPAPSPPGWFERVRPHCNAIEAEITLKRDPAPAAPESQADAAACYALAGKIALAKKTLDALPEGARVSAAHQVFGIVHPIADQGDDAATGPIMRLILDYTPDNFMALYHAGVAEYQSGDIASARPHLVRFLELYRVDDGWGQSGRRILAAIDSPPAEKKCDGPLFVDPEGRAVRAPGCP